MSYLKITVQTSAKKPGIVNFKGDVLKIKVRAVPVDGKANKELFHILSKILELRPFDMRLVRGFHSKNKLIEIEDLSDEQIVQRIMANTSSDFRSDMTR